MNSSSMEMEKEFKRFLVSSAFECPDIENLVDFYVDGDLPQELAPKFQSHLMKCSACSELVDDVVAIVDVARTLSSRSLPEGVKARLREHLKQEVDLRPPSKLYLIK